MKKIYFIIIAFNVFASLNAQDLQPYLQKTAREIFNPTYAIVKMPNGNDFKILKSQKNTIQKFLKDHQFVKDSLIHIRKPIYFIEKLILQDSTWMRQITIGKKEDVIITRKRIMIKPPSTRVEVIPAEYETVTEKVLSKPCSPTIITVPAEYKTVYDTIVKPEYQKVIGKPAEYETVTETVEVSPATRKWVKRKTDKNCTNSDSCEVFVLVEVPAKYETITKTVLKTSGHARLITVPAEYQRIGRRVFVKPAYTKEIDCEPEYQLVTKQVVKNPSKCRTLDVPAEYKMVIDTIYFHAKAKLSTIYIPAEYEITTKNIEGRQVKSAYLKRANDGVMQHKDIQTADIIKIYQPKSRFHILPKEVIDLIQPVYAKIPYIKTEDLQSDIIIEKKYQQYLEDEIKYQGLYKLDNVEYISVNTKVHYSEKWINNHLFTKQATLTIPELKKSITRPVVDTTDNLLDTTFFIKTMDSIRIYVPNVKNLFLGNNRRTYIKPQANPIYAKVEQFNEYGDSSFKLILKKEEKQIAQIEKDSHYVFYKNEIITIDTTMMTWYKRRAFTCCLTANDDCQIWGLGLMNVRMLDTIKIYYFKNIPPNHFKIKTKAVKPINYHFEKIVRVQKVGKVEEIERNTDKTQKVARKAQKITNVKRKIIEKEPTIYPNPTTNILNIKSSTTIQNITILNTKGQVIFNKTIDNQNNTSLSLKDFASGSYIILIKTNDKTQTQKFIKQ